MKEHDLNNNRNSAITEKTISSIVQKDDDRTESSIEEDVGDIFSSRDYTPQTTKMTYIVLEDNDDETAYNDIQDEERWTLGVIDLISYLNVCINKSMMYNNTKTDRELSPSRLLSLHHMYYFPLESKNSCLKDFLNNYLDVVYANLDSESGLIRSLPTDIVLYANDIIDACATKNEGAIAVALGEVLVKAGKATTATATTKEKDTLLKAAYTITDVARQLLRSNSNSRGHCKGRIENTFIHQYLSPGTSAQLAIYDAPQGETGNASSSTETEGATITDIKSKKMYPDFTLYAQICDRRFDLLVIEVKPPGSHLALSDQRKLHNGKGNIRKPYPYMNC